MNNGTGARLRTKQLINGGALRVSHVDLFQHCAVCGKVLEDGYTRPRKYCSNAHAQRAAWLRRKGLPPDAPYVLARSHRGEAKIAGGIY